MASGWTNAAGSLEASARLQVMGHPAEGEEQPVDHGTYLGPSNQLIRVQISRLDDDGMPFLVWGYDNASFMYRLSRVDPDRGGGHHGCPAGHRPGGRLPPASGESGRRSAARAASLRRGVHRRGDGSGRHCHPGLRSGHANRRHRHAPPAEVTWLQRPLFLRVWNEELKCRPGEEHELGDTGLRVRLRPWTRRRGRSRRLLLDDRGTPGGRPRSGGRGVSATGSWTRRNRLTARGSG